MPRRVGRCREKPMWCFPAIQRSTYLIKSSFCPPYPCALESYSFISRIFPLDTCQNKEYGLCISFILLYIRSLSHLNVEPHQRADLGSARRSALHLGGKSGFAGPPWLLRVSQGCWAPPAVPYMPGGQGQRGRALGRGTAKEDPGKDHGLLEITSEVAEFFYLLLLSNFWCASVVFP